MVLIGPRHLLGLGPSLINFNVILTFLSITVLGVAVWSALVFDKYFSIFYLKTRPLFIIFVLLFESRALCRDGYQHRCWRVSFEPSIQNDVAFLEI